MSNPLSQAEGRPPWHGEIEIAAALEQAHPAAYWVAAAYITHLIKIGGALEIDLAARKRLLLELFRSMPPDARQAFIGHACEVGAW